MLTSSLPTGDHIDESHTYNYYAEWLWQHLTLQFILCNWIHLKNRKIKMLFKGNNPFVFSLYKSSCLICARYTMGSWPSLIFRRSRYLPTTSITKSLQASLTQYIKVPPCALAYNINEELPFRMNHDQNMVNAQERLFKLFLSQSPE